jgi:hypothetical protein
MGAKSRCLETRAVPAFPGYWEPYKLSDTPQEKIHR